MSKPAVKTDWPEGDKAINTAMLWLQKKYSELGSPLFVIDEEWCRLEDDINAVYSSHDLERLRSALQDWARHIVSRMRAAAKRQAA